MNKAPTEEQKDKWHKDPKNWRFGVFYYNKTDKRLFPPKRFKMMGWTVNWANPHSILSLAVLILAILLIFKIASKFS